MLVIGYNKDELILVNSWGSTYGDNGIFYLDINSEIIREFWALEDIKNILNYSGDIKKYAKNGGVYFLGITNKKLVQSLK